MIGRPLRCTVIGDANLDYIANATSAIESWADAANACVFTRVSECVGGNGVFFAEAATATGYRPVRLKMSIGMDANGEADLAGRTVMAHLEKHDIEYDCTLSNRPTGKTIIVYHGEDERLLVADRGANVEKSSSSRSNGEGEDLLYLSGYCLIDDKERQKVLSAVQRYRESGTFVFLDLVPHDIYTRTSWESYLTWCENVDGIAIEAQTLLGFLGLSGINDASTRGVDELQARFRLSLLRLNSASDYVLATPSDRLDFKIRYSRQESSLRFTDHVIAGVTHQYLLQGKTMPANQDWIEEIQKRVEP